MLLERFSGYGFVVFRKESSVNTVMSERPHTIDGQQVEIYRSIPDQGPLKDTKGIKELIVSGFKNRSITKSDLQKYFCGFGKINNIDMNDNDDSYCIEFDE
jgi:RNA recognition motif-containing protein